MTGIHLAAIQLVLSVVHVREQQNVLLSVLTLPFTAYFLGGLIRFFAILVRDPSAPAPWRLLFLTDLRRYWHMLLFLVYYYFLYVTLVKVVVEIPEYQGIIQIRLVAGLCLFLWLVARLVFAPLYIIDEGLAVRAAIKNSYMLTTGRTRRTLLLSLTFLAVLWLGVFAVGVGAIYTLAISLTGVVLLFDNYRNGPRARDRLQLIELDAHSRSRKKTSGRSAKKAPVVRRVVKKRVVKKKVEHKLPEKES